MTLLSTIDVGSSQQSPSEFFPLDCRRVAPSVETAREIGPKELFESPLRSRVAPVWITGPRFKRYRSAKPLQVHVSFEEGLFFAENEALLLCGTGKSPEQAIEDLLLHVVYFYGYYKRLSNSQVTGEALRLKRIYEGLLLEG